MPEVTITLTKDEHDYLSDLANRRGITATQKATEIVTDSLGYDDYFDKVIERAIEEIEHNEPDFYSYSSSEGIAECSPCCCKVASPPEIIEPIKQPSPFKRVMKKFAATFAI